MYGRESKKIKAKAIDSNTTALNEKKAEEEVKNHTSSGTVSLQSSTDSKASLYSQYGCFGERLHRACLSSSSRCGGARTGHSCTALTQHLSQEVSKFLEGDICACREAQGKAELTFTLEQCSHSRVVSADLELNL